ncbi:MAG: ATP-binding protein [Imperialibacter sp.]|uniref:ATP-binding protein n=1 Tax=Imperialibacter sp. TaxID=2038411 RepID=UPI0030D74099|tara:strand:- start:54 stop:1226 length:1173 start_codon:yes stop_codon:yes gene_type:complete
MIPREIQRQIQTLLTEFPAVAILGPRQVGKTTLADAIAKTMKSKSVYLDLELPSDLSKLHEPEQYFELHKGKLIILDEIQRAPELFSILRGVIDHRKREGYTSGQFLILGSASLDLLKQSSESLAGRIAFTELTGLSINETYNHKTDNINRLWLRGGFPDSYTAPSDQSSFRWRSNFISTYLERDIPQLGSRIPATTLRRLWTMLAHSQGSQVNMSTLATGLDTSVTSIKRYLDLLEDLLLIRTLRPWAGNVGKRLVKSPKVYIRDSGLTHSLLNLITMDDLLGHTIAGLSWEGFVMENMLSNLKLGSTPWFYRTSAGAEIDLIIEKPGGGNFAIEIKKSLTPVLSKGFYHACEDVRAVERFVVYPGTEEYSIGNGVIAIPVGNAMQLLQ